MDQPVDLEALDDWMYALTAALVELSPRGRPESVTLLQRTLDDMRERRAQLLLRTRSEQAFPRPET